MNTSKFEKLLHRYVYFYGNGAKPLKKYGGRERWEDDVAVEICGYDNAHIYFDIEIENGNMSEEGCKIFGIPIADLERILGKRNDDEK